MAWRFGGALMLAALLAGCTGPAGFQGSSGYALGTQNPAVEPVPQEAQTVQQAPASEPPAAAPELPPAPNPTPPQGKFGVQIAAPRSEADARAMLDEMRAKYPAELGREWATINPVAQPEGVVYRVMIGPLATEQQASQLCNSLKARGATCFIRGT